MKKIAQLIMTTVVITTANVGTKIGLHATIVSLPTLMQLLIFTTVIAVIVSAINAVATLSSVTVVAIVITAVILSYCILILYANRYAVRFMINDKNTEYLKFRRRDIIYIM